MVTGAAQGVGRATALRLAAEGARVFLVDRAREVCAGVLDSIACAGGQAQMIVADLEQYDGVRNMVGQVVQAAGAIDVAVHNVGGTIWMKPFWEYAPDEIEREINRSLWPTLWCCHAVIPLMRKQGRGAIVNVGSAVTRGNIYRVPYAAAKAGIHTATLCLASELGDCGVRINCVAPGALDNADRRIARNDAPLSEQELAWQQEVYRRSGETTSLGRRGTADEVAAAICFLASDEAAFVTGQTLSVAGGATV